MTARLFTAEAVVAAAGLVVAATGSSFASGQQALPMLTAHHIGDFEAAPAPEPGDVSPISSKARAAIEAQDGPRWWGRLLIHPAQVPTA